MRVLVDPNVLVSALLTETRPSSVPRQVVAAAASGSFTILVADDAIDELVRVTSTRPHLRRTIRPRSVDALVDLLRSAGVVLPPIEDDIPAVCRDPRDDYLIAQAFRGNADVLVSGDPDLLALDGTGLPFRVLSPRDFLTLLDDANGG